MPDVHTNAPSAEIKNTTIAATNNKVRNIGLLCAFSYFRAEPVLVAPRIHNRTASSAKQKSSTRKVRNRRYSRADRTGRKPKPRAAPYRGIVVSIIGSGSGMSGVGEG